MPFMPELIKLDLWTSSFYLDLELKPLIGRMGEQRIKFLTT